MGAPRVGEPLPRPSASFFSAMTPDRDLEALILAARDGNAFAQTRLYDRFAPGVRGLLVRLLGPDAELADVLQDTFLSVFRGLPRLDSPYAFTSWLTQVAVMQARMALRSRRRRWWLELFPPDELPEAPAAGTGVVDQALRELYAILDTLPADARLAFSLRFIEGYTLEEVAELCGYSLATAKRRLAEATTVVHARARAALHLREWLDESVDGSRQGGPHAS